MKCVYPKIPKEYFAATMFACKIIRETNYFNKAIKTASDYYGVDEGELKKHVVARTNEGKRAKKKSGYTYKYFVVSRSCFSEAQGEFNGDSCVAKGLSKDHVQRRYSAVDSESTRSGDTGSSFCPRWYSRVVYEATDKDDAIAYMIKNKKQLYCASQYWASPYVPGSILLRDVDEEQ